MTPAKCPQAETPPSLPQPSEHASVEDLDSLSDDMFAMAAAMLGIPLHHVSLDAIATAPQLSYNPTDSWIAAIDHEKVLDIGRRYVEYGSRSEQAAWISLHEDIGVTDAAQQFGLARTSVSRARSKLISELQNLLR